MAINFPKKQEQRLIPKYLLDYLGEVNELNPDPSDLGKTEVIDMLEAQDRITPEEYAKLGVNTIIRKKVRSIPDNETYDYYYYASEDNTSITYTRAIPFGWNSGEDGRLTIRDLKINKEPSSSLPQYHYCYYTFHYYYIQVPTVNNNTITITQGGDTKGTFTLNQSSDQTIDLNDGIIYEAGTGIDITNDTISVDNNVAMKTDIPTNYVTTDTAQTITEDKKFTSFVEFGDDVDFNGMKTYINIADVSEMTIGPDCLYFDSLTTNYNNLEEVIIALDNAINDIPTKTSDLTNDSGYITSSALNGYATEQYVQNQGYITGITSSDVTTALGYTPGTSNFSGSYNDLSNKPTIPTKTSDLTNDSGFITSSSLNNYVTLDSNQNITGVKTFVGDKKLKFKQSGSANKLGFTLYDYRNWEKGYLEYNPTDNGMYLGRWGDSRVNELGFKTSASAGTHKLLVPNVTLSGTVTDYIPISVNNTKADSSGNISIAIPDVSNYYTKTEVDNLIPTVPTNVSSFTNDAGYITASVSTLTNYYDKTYIDNTVGDIETLLAAL